MKNLNRIKLIKYKLKNKSSNYFIFILTTDRSNIYTLDLMELPLKTRHHLMMNTINISPSNIHTIKGFKKFKLSNIIKVLPVAEKHLKYILKK